MRVFDLPRNLPQNGGSDIRKTCSRKSRSLPRDLPQNGGSNISRKSRPGVLGLIKPSSERRVQHLQKIPPRSTGTDQNVSHQKLRRRGTFLRTEGPKLHQIPDKRNPAHPPRSTWTVAGTFLRTWRSYFCTQGEDSLVQALGLKSPANPSLSHCPTWRSLSGGCPT